MAKIIRLTDDKVSIGMDDGSLLTVSYLDMNFQPSLGDEVEIFRDATSMIVTKKDAPMQVDRWNGDRWDEDRWDDDRRYDDRRGQNSARPIIINNNISNNNIGNNIGNNYGYGRGRRISKWVAFFLCLFLGCIGAHKFYEHRYGWGILYLFTVGIGGIGWIIDLIAILLKPDPYYV